MRTWMEVGLMVEAGLFAGVLSLFLAWLGMRLFFSLMPAARQVAAAPNPRTLTEKMGRAA